MARPRQTVVHRRRGLLFWHDNWTVQGVVLRGSAGTDDKALAEEIALKARQDLIEQIRLGRPPRASEMTVDEALGRYWEEYASHLQSSRALWTQLKALHDGLCEATLLSAIDAAVVARYVARRRSAPRPLIVGRDGRKRRQKGPPGPPAGTINRELVPLGAILRRARETWCANVGAANVRKHPMPERRDREVFLDRDQTRRLVDAIVPHARAPVAIALMTGLRRGNVLALDWDKHVSLAEARITPGVKDGKVHTVPLTPDAVVLLAGLEPDPERRHGPVFRFGNPAVGCGCLACRRRKGKRISSVKRSFATAERTIGLGHVRFHDLRHTFASWLIQAGAGIKVARDLLGHADLATTDEYAHLEQGAQARAVQAAIGGFGRELKANNAQNVETTKRNVI